MRTKSQAAKNWGKANLSTEATPQSAMTTLDQKFPQPERPEDISPSSKKVKTPLASRRPYKKKVNKFSVRRSERIQNSCTSRNLKIQNVIEEITISESDDEDRLPIDHEESLPPSNQANDWPELMLGEKDLVGKLDYLVKLLETQGHSINSIKDEVIKKFSPIESVPAPDLKYKSMYISSQKKIEKLAEENRLLTLKLESALDQFEAYKKGTRDVFEVLEKLKDVILISNSSRVSEAAAAAQATSQVALDKVTSPNPGDVPPSTKRRKQSRQN